LSAYAAAEYDRRPQRQTRRLIRVSRSQRVSRVTQAPQDLAADAIDCAATFMKWLCCPARNASNWFADRVKGVPRGL
jgi:hypothetical protein